MSFKWAVNWMGRQKWRLILSIVLNIVGVGLMTYEPFIFSDIVDNILMPQEFDRLLPALGYSLFIGSLFMICRYFVSILAEQAAQHAVYQLKGALFDKLLKQTPSFFRGTAPKYHSSTAPTSSSTTMAKGARSMAKVYSRWTGVAKKACT